MSCHALYNAFKLLQGPDLPVCTCEYVYLDAARLLLKKVHLALQQLHIRPRPHANHDNVALNLLAALQDGGGHLQRQISIMVTAQPSRWQLQIGRAPTSSTRMSLLTITML